MVCCRISLRRRDSSLQPVSTAAPPWEKGLMLLAVRPCNMLVLMTAFLQSYGTISHGAFTEQSSYMEIWPHIVNELESTGGVVIAGPLEYSTVLEIHPAE